MGRESPWTSTNSPNGLALKAPDGKSNREAVLTPQCLRDLEYWTRTKPKRARRVFKLVRSTLRDPFDGLGKPEPLRGEFAGSWSRRIDGEHRLIYQVAATRVYFLSARDHY
ncbi:Txe/YoeB family addiction module toxin [Candidatus Palauibacter sp.]|uniref:Txe/YoeB family addiction module toxin n=1 Tax=Candidatus Palauibacter sp. TaxID=3101350 RepID=UPI003B017882